MKKNILTIAILTGLFVSSCKETPKQENKESTTEKLNKTTEVITPISVTDKDGKKLDFTLNETKGTATIHFNGETIELLEQQAASGIWYKNESYELHGKGDKFSLSKNQKIIFTNEDEITFQVFKDSTGNFIDFKNNATKQTATIRIGDTTEEIHLIDQQPANGYWFKNDEYELRGKNDKVELTKNGKVIFKN